MNTKELIHRWFDGLWNQKNPGIIDEMMDPDASGTTEAGVIQGIDQFKTMHFKPLLDAFPDIHVSLDGILSEGDEGVVRWTVTGTHLGPFADIPPTKKKVSFSGMTWVKFKDGKMVEGLDRFNLHGVIAYLSGGAQCASVRDGACVC